MRGPVFYLRINAAQASIELNWEGEAGVSGTGMSMPTASTPTPRSVALKVEFDWLSGYPEEYFSSCVTWNSSLLSVGGSAPHPHPCRLKNICVLPEKSLGEKSRHFCNTVK